MGNFTVHIPPPCAEEVKTLLVDDDILVVSKPSGLLSVRGRYVKDSVEHRMAFEYGDAVIVHRLDLDTSGLMVLARSKLAARELSRQFRERLVKKEYVAVVWGHLSDPSGVIDFPLAPDPHNRPRHLVDVAGGKEAITRYEVTGSLDHSDRLLLQPETGRSHQLRVHLSHMGHPILGCDLYAHDDAFKASSRLLLHASRLTFPHPRTGEPVTIPDPPGF